MNSERPTRLRFSLSHLLILVTGMAIGFAPLQWWRSRQPPSEYSVTVHVADVPVGKLAAMGLPDSTNNAKLLIMNIDKLLGSLKKLHAVDDQLHYWSTTYPVADGHTPRWLNGGGMDVPTVMEDGTVAILERYEGDIISVSPERLRNGNILLTFDLTTQQLDYSTHVMAGKTEVYPQFERSLKSQVEIPAGGFIAIPAGKRNDRDGVNRELIYLLSATQTN